VVDHPATQEIVEEVLEKARTIAVLGAHTQEHKPAFYVPEYLFQKGYRILPVNPVFAGRELWGEPFEGRLADLEEVVDVVDVFRRSEAMPEHLGDILAMKPLPRWVWMQQGIRHDGVADRLTREGITVIQDRCLLADHRRWAKPR
jgi:predicted CoA-binding protein